MVYVALRVREGISRRYPNPPPRCSPERLQSVDEQAGAFLLSKREPTRSAYRRDLADFATFLAAAGVALSWRRGATWCPPSRPRAPGDFVGLHLA
jgi:hypothetical protein